MWMLARRLVVRSPLARCSLQREYRQVISPNGMVFIAISIPSKCWVTEEQGESVESKRNDSFW